MLDNLLERYNTREVRYHVKHLLEILNSIKLKDAYGGRDQMSLSFLSSITMGDILGKDFLTWSFPICFYLTEYHSLTRSKAQPF